MDKLKNFIETHRADFDEAYPSLPQGHEARFMRRLEEEKTVVMPQKGARPKGLYLLYAVAMAASVALLLLLRLSTPNTTEATDSYLAEVQQIQTDENRQGTNERAHGAPTRARRDGHLAGERANPGRQPQLRAK